MEREHLIEDAERVATIAMTRWQHEYDDEVTDEHSNVSAIHADDIGHCLLAFRIEHIERTSIDNHDAPKPITDYFLADVTLTLTPRPHTKMPLAEMRANAVDTDIVTRRYHVKHFVDQTWLVMHDL